MDASAQKSSDGVRSALMPRAAWEQIALYSSLPVMAFDRDGCIHRATSAAAGLFHASPAALEGTRLAGKLDTKGAESFAIHLERVFGRRMPCVCELKFDLPSHGVLWIRLNSQIDDGVEPSIMCWAWIENVTAGRQGEQQEASYRRMVRTALKSGSLKEAGGKIFDILMAHEHADGGCIAMLDEHSGMVDYPAVSGDDRPGRASHAPNEQLAGYVLSSGQVAWWHELRLDGKKSGPLFDFPREPVPSDLIAVPLKSGRAVNGVFIAYKAGPDRLFNQRDVELMIAVAHVLEAVMARNKAKDVESFLVASLQQSPEPVMITDPKGLIEYVNKAFERVTGYNADEVVGSPASILKSERQDPATYRALWEMLAAGKPWHGHFINRDKRGQLFEEDALIWPVKERGGDAVVRYIAIKHILNGQNAAEPVDARTVDDAIFNPVASVFMHDFRNMLLSIRMNADLVGSGASDAVADEVRQIVEDVKQAETLLDHISALTAPVGRVLRDVDLNQQVARIQSLAAKLMGSDRRLQVELEPRLAPVRIPGGLIEKMLTTLLFHAQRVARPSQSLVIRTFRDSIHESDRPHFIRAPGRLPHDYSVIEFAGGGLAAGFIQSQVPVHSNESDAQWASGLPELLLQLLDRHGYLMARHMTGDQGLIRIYFEAASPAAAPAAIEPMTADAAEARASETVLVAEDDPVARRVIRRILEGSGYRVLEAENGATAVRTLMFSDVKVDVLIADIMMPDFDGKTLADQVTNLNPAIKILFVSGFDLEDLERRNISLGGAASMLVKKPFNRDELLGMLRKCLRGA